MSLHTVLVIAKEPVPGRVKTRLVPPLTYAEAAAVASASIADTLTALDRLDVRCRILALDGCPGPWVTDGWQVVDQGGGGLDRRLVRAFAAARSGPAVLVGMDTPQVTAELIQGFDPRQYDACLGLSTDGGYWALGLRDPRIAAAVIPGVPMSTADTGAVQLARLHAAGLRVQLLPQLTDVDTIDDAVVVAGLAPNTRFAAALTPMLATAG